LREFPLHGFKESRFLESGATAVSICRTISACYFEKLTFVELASRDCSICRIMFARLFGERVFLGTSVFAGAPFRTKALCQFQDGKSRRRRPEAAARAQIT
jgi:hypothetical protein